MVVRSGKIGQGMRRRQVDKTGSKTMDEIEIIQVELPVEKFNLRIRDLIKALLEIDEEMFSEQSDAKDSEGNAA
jgi:hypothetical protein